MEPCLESDADEANEAGYFCGTYVRVGLQFEWVLDWIGLYWDENMVILEKLDFGELSGIMGGLEGYLQRKVWT